MSERERRQFAVGVIARLWIAWASFVLILRFT